MIKHILKLIWNRKSSNSLMFLEIFLSFLVLFAVISNVIYNADRIKLPLGFETKNKLVIYLDSYEGKDILLVHETQKNLYKSLKEMNHVNFVGFSNSVSPYSGNTWQSGGDEMGFNILARYAFVDEHFGEAIGLKIEEGRYFNEDDLTSNYEPMIVSRSFMEAYFPDKSMIDSTIFFSGDRKIVGIMEDYRYNGRFEEPVHTLLFLKPKTDQSMTTVYLDLDDNTPANFEEELNNVVQSITKTTSFVIQDLSQKEKRSDRTNWIPIIALLIISGFLCVNVALGLFGVLWYTISKRRSEIGLRRAIGASPWNIKTQFMYEILMLTGISIVAGIFFAIQVPILKLVPIESSIFYRAIFFAVIIILAIVTLCTIYPSSQASKIHPAKALHED